MQSYDFLSGGNKGSLKEGTIEKMVGRLGLEPRTT